MADASPFSRETVLEIARCHARAAFRELVRELEAAASDKSTTPETATPANSGKSAGVFSHNSNNEISDANRNPPAPLRAS